MSVRERGECEEEGSVRETGECEGDRCEEEGSARERGECVCVCQLTFTKHSALRRTLLGWRKEGREGRKGGEKRMGDSPTYLTM